MDYDSKSIYDPSVPDCLKNIIDKFKPSENFSINTGSFDNALQQQLNIAGQTLALFNNDGDYSIQFEVVDIPVNSNGVQANARTIPDISVVNGVDVLNSVNIQFHTGYVGAATDLALARSAIHELLHAYLLHAA